MPFLELYMWYIHIHIKVSFKDSTDSCSIKHKTVPSSTGVKEGRAGSPLKWQIASLDSKLYKILN